MQQETKTTRELAIEWWETFDFEKKYIKAYKTFHTEINIHKVTDEDIEHIYLSEHPQTTEKGEDVQVGWLYFLKDVKPFCNNATCGKYHLSIMNNGERFAIAEGYRENDTLQKANHIVTCVNNFDAMYNALKEVNTLLDGLINRTESGKKRNELCDINITVKTALTNISNK